MIHSIRKRLPLVLLFGLMLIWLGPVINTQASSQGTRKTFTVGFDAEFPPYGYQNDDGEYIGFDLDLAEEVCKRQGWELKKQPIEWNSKDMELETGLIDCIWNGFTMNGREEKYTWSVPYVDNSQVVIVRKDSNIAKLNDLAGKVVAVQADSSALAALTGEDAEEKNLELAKTFEALQQLPDYNSAFMNLEIGAVDAICMDIGVASYEIESRDNTYTMLEEQISSEQYGIGFLLGNTELRDQVQNTLLEMLDDGTFSKIAKDWGLEECVCLSHDSKTFDQAEVTKPLKSKAKKQKKDFKWTVEVVKQLLSGFGDTLVIFFLTLIFSLPLGLLIAFGRMSKLKLLQYIMKLYISIMRGTPLMLQLFVVFYGPSYVFGLTTPKNYRLYAVIIGFALNYAAYFAEIYRAGIQGVPRGQHEAAAVLGYSKPQTFCKIIFPQMCKNIMPPVTNEVITLVKDTSLAFTLSYAEMFTVAKFIASKQTTLIPLIIAGVFYYIFNFAVAFTMEKIEKKLSYY